MLISDRGVYSRLALRRRLETATTDLDPPFAVVDVEAWAINAASLTARAGRDRLPTPWLPAGLQLDGLEGAGEVQTPLLGAAADGLRVGDRVWFRHAKAGEPAEHFLEVHLLSGVRVVDAVPTYRGEGRCFL